jgi:hypothetical protein
MTSSFSKLFSHANDKIIIVGLNPLAVELDDNAGILFDVLNLNQNLSIHIFYESDSENFNQSLSLSSNKEVSSTKLNLCRDRIIGRVTKYGLTGGIKSKIDKYFNDKTKVEGIAARIIFKQLNTRMPINLIKVDDRFYYSIATHKLTGLSHYLRAEVDSTLYSQFDEYLKAIDNNAAVGIYNSKPGQELIQLYDNDRYPRGIYPRSAFYTTKFKRYSVWGLIFNRNGELLMHQRSKHTKDNRLLWDKSIGGHVDLKDRGTQVTAKRELVEELFLPNDEYTKYVSADLGEILDFGEWNISKRPESQFKGVFESIGPLDWIMFRATDNQGDPLTTDRISERTIIKDKLVKRLRTVFISDVYLFIAPGGLIDDQDQLIKLVEPAQKSGAAEDHKLISPNGLSSWVDSEEENNNATNVFTDDMVYMRLNHMPLLEEFSEFVKYIAK